MSEDIILSLLRSIDQKQDEQSNQLIELKMTLVQHQANFKEHLVSDQLMAKDLSEISEHLEMYNQELIKHIAGVEQLKILNQSIKTEFDNRHKSLDARLKEIEAPRDFVKTAVALTVKIAGIAGAIAAAYVAIKQVIP
jgi:hypothetical protein